jgi:transcriptional regulator GlxA family with amidase domain
LLHAAGFLRGKRATTYWAQRDALRARGEVEVVAERWVHDGNVITAAGVSAGIDMALYLVGVLKGPEEARRLQKMIEYDPSPPYAELGV